MADAPEEVRRYRRAGEMAGRFLFTVLIGSAGFFVGKQFGWSVGFVVALALFALNGIHDELIRHRPEKEIGPHASDSHRSRHAD